MIDQRQDVNILSTPRITTLNNQKATIKVVKKVMLQKTQEALQTAEAITVEFESDDEAREIGVTLTVIPHVNETGDIVVNLIPQVSSNLQFTQLQVGASDENTVAMTYETREANTQVRIRNNETIFIGGLIKDRVTNIVNKVPVLGDLFSGIPVLDKMFKYEAEQIDKTEIIFFVTVHIVENGIDSIQKSYTTYEYERYQQDYYKKQMAKKRLKQEKKRQRNKDTWFNFSPKQEDEYEDAVDMASDETVDILREEDSGEIEAYEPWFYRKKK